VITGNARPVAASRRAFDGWPKFANEKPPLGDNEEEAGDALLLEELQEEGTPLEQDGLSRCWRLLSLSLDGTDAAGSSRSTRKEASLLAPPCPLASPSLVVWK
jgi:hypothetical protein